MFTPRSTDEVAVAVGEVPPDGDGLLAPRAACSDREGSGARAGLEAAAANELT